MPRPNNIPVHRPLYPSSLIYGAEDAKVASVLLEVPEDRVRALLAETPFDFVSAHAWIELMVLDEPFGVARFMGGGVVVPASYKGTVGGYYAFCYLDTDDGLALGREPFGYPKKYTDCTFQATGRAVTASAKRRDAAIEISVVTGAGPAKVPDVPRYPHLLLQVIPSAESTEVLLERVILRNTGAVSEMETKTGEGAFALPETAEPSELAWLEGAKAVAGLYSRGAFRSALATVLGTVTVGREIKAALRAVTHAGE